MVVARRELVWEVCQPWRCEVAVAGRTSVYGAAPKGGPGQDRGQIVNRIFLKPWLAKRRWPIAVLAAALAVGTSLGVAGWGGAASVARAASGTPGPGEAHG